MLMVTLFIYAYERKIMTKLFFFMFHGIEDNWSSKSLHIYIKVVDFVDMIWLTGNFIKKFTTLNLTDATHGILFISNLLVFDNCWFFSQFQYISIIDKNEAGQLSQMFLS